MEDIEFKNGFLCGLLSTGLGISSSVNGGTGHRLPELEQLVIINLNAYDNVATYLKASNYTTVVSSEFSYAPKQGYIMIGGYIVYDYEADNWWETPEADIRVMIDGELIFEGDVDDFFYNSSMDPPQTYQYKSSFEIAAKRRNMSDGMQLLLRETMLVGLK